MKELSIEEKARRYDGAKARAKNFIENGDERERTVAESIFAGIMEESEDERIRKALIRFHKSTIDVDGIKGDDVLAWLEKQGDKTAWSEDDEGHIYTISNILEDRKNQQTEVGIKILDKEIAWLKSLRPQNTWKPSDEQMRVLDLAIRCGINRGTTEETTLVSLFNDLKKLREE